MESARPRLIRRALLLCTLPLLLLHAACDSVETVEVAAPGAPLAVGSTFQMTAQAKGRSGDILTNRAVSWSSSAPGVASVDGGGLVTALAPGNATVSATIEGKTGSASVTVVLPVTAPTVVTLPASDITANSGRMNGTVNPNNGSTTWGFDYGTSSSNLADSCTGTAPVTGNQAVGVACTLTGIPADVPTLYYRVYAQNSAGRSNGEVRSFSTTGGGGGSSVTLSGISPDPLVEGQSATLTGSGFSTTAGNNQVTVGGMVATVTAATATSLQITVPSACQPEGNTEVRVTVGTQQSNTLQHPFRPSQFLNLPVGQQLILRNPTQHCLQFQQSNGSEAYLIGVQSTSEVISNVTQARVQAVAAAAAGGAPASLAPPLPVEGASQAAARPLSQQISRAVAARAAHDAAEASLRSWEQAYFASRLNRMLRPEPAARGLEPQAMALNPKVGDIVPIRVPDFSKNNGCRDFTAINTVVRTIGTRAIWLEDVGNPANGFTGADFEALKTFFDTQVYDVLVDYFGAPTDFDQNGRILIVATKEVNKVPGVGGFATIVDLYPRTECPASDQGEVYYAQVPDPAGTVGNAAQRQNVFLNTKRLLPHEVTHVIQFGRRGTFQGATGLMTIWEMEGQGTFAEEVTGFAINGRRTGQNYGASIVFNEPASSEVNWHLGHAFSGLFAYYGFRSPTAKTANAPEQCSWLDREEAQPGGCVGFALPYGPTWAFLRWISDHYGSSYPGGEKALHRALIQNRHVGFATLADVVKVPIWELLAQWAAMLYVDDRVPGAHTRLTLPSWNLLNIEQSVVESARLLPRQQSFASFNDAVTVRAGSTAYFRVSGAGRPGTAIRVRDSAGNPLPNHMQVWIVRLQ